MKSILIKAGTLLFFILVITACNQNVTAQTLQLGGVWEVSLDSLNTSINLLNFNLKATLPGTLDEAGIGKENRMIPEMKREVMLHLQRKHEYIGKAWYRKTIIVPESVKGKKAILKLERVLWKSTIYIDGVCMGSENSLSIPHYYNLSSFLSSGEHQMLICIDNSKQFDLNKANMAHAYTNETQIMWNGILGDFKIDFCETDLRKIQVYPDLSGKKVRVKVLGEMIKDAQLQLVVKSKTDKKTIISKVFAMNPDGFYSLDMNQEIKLWNEFTPNLYSLETSLILNGKVIQKDETIFGFRSLETQVNKLVLNGNPLFLRGTLECCIFPLTGHPPLDVKDWLKEFKNARSYGLNHLRFHSWCPPEAAFKAADQVGFYLQVELPNWNTSYGKDSKTAEFIESEATRIISEYGNHPSFCFMSMGNEMEGDFNRLTGLVKSLKNIDKRHLYTTSSFTFEKGHGKYPEAVDDYFITQYTDSGWVRGQGVFDTEYPNFNTDYTKAVKHLPVPLITHEIGQYSVFPNLKEIKKYTGVLDPLNFKAIRNDLQKKGLLNLANDYMMASGKLAALLYKEEIERALKTTGISGFQLLDLHDFPGQGTALVGLLDAFWDSKGIIDNLAFKQFCSEVVPLIWMVKAVYLNTEELSVEIGVANFFQDFHNKILKLELLNKHKQVIQQREIQFAEIQSGKTSKLGQFKFDLTGIKNASQLTIRLSIEGTHYENSWPIWVYPKTGTEEYQKEIVVTQSFDEAEKALNAGKKVLLNPNPEELNGLQGKFVQVFWSPVHFPDQPGTMGLLMNPSHPVFNVFPTEFHSNWQWWNLCKQSKTLDISGIKVTPLIRVVDNFYKNRSLTNLFEAKVGQGKLILSSINLTDKLDNRIEARQLRLSIIQYLKSDSFNPVNEISLDLLRNRFKK